MVRGWRCSAVLKHTLHIFEFEELYYIKFISSAHYAESNEGVSAEKHTALELEVICL